MPSAPRKDLAAEGAIGDGHTRWRRGIVTQGVPIQDAASVRATQRYLPPLTSIRDATA